ncbi:sensor histidine kinase [Dactylosporangium sp. CA-139066]|uniref:sensor histidine kinase n=1 Tax=Dactylosporangium sp. CA-139066 TaxID=3239930 RepID=UPI003D913B22
MLWVGRLFEERYTAVRLLVVTLAGVGYLTLVPEGRSMSNVDHWLSAGVMAWGFVGVRWPFAAATGIAVLCAAGYLIGADNDAVPTVGQAWALFELGARRHGPQVPAGFAAGLAGTVLSDVGDLLADPVMVLFGALTVTGAALLLGVHVRAVGELGRRAAAQDVARVRAEERTAIARELHDLVAHHVASIVLRVGVARNVLPLADPRVRQVLDDVHATGAGALADLRRLVALLRDPDGAQQAALADPAGLPTAIAAAVDRGRQVGLAVEADVDPAVATLDARTALAVLRLTQEGLANAARHAGADARAALTVRVTGDRLEFDLRSAGRRAPARLVAGSGVGLIGLRERVDVLGGTLAAGPDEHGWRLSATVPLEKEPT